MLCGDMILKHNVVNTQSATKEARNIHSGTCEGSHLARSQSRPSDAALESLYAAAAAAAATPKRLRNAKPEEASRLSHTWRSHTPACSQPSRSHRRTPPARNSAFVSTPSLALILRGSVLSYDRGRGLVHRQQGSAWMSKQVRAR